MTKLPLVLCAVVATGCVIDGSDPAPLPGGGGGGLGGGSGSGSGSGGGGGGGGGTGGALLYEYASDAVRFDLATKSAIELPLASGITERIGRGGSLMTDVTVDSDNDAYAITVRQVTASGFPVQTSIPPFRVSTGFITGSVQPSPNGSLFAMHTRERAGLGEPQIDYVYVFDAAPTVRMRIAGYGYPAWLPDGRLVVVGPEGLYTSTVGSAPSLQHVGPSGLGAAQWLTVSPSGAAIAFELNDSIYRINTDGSGLVRLSQPDSVQYPAWSPDGSQLAVISGVCSGTIPTSVITVLSASTPDQSIDSAPRVQSSSNVAVRACGALFWLP